MAGQTSSIPIADVVLDNEIYPRSAIDHRRVQLFAENLRAGFTFEPIDVQVHPENGTKYRILDGVRRWKAYKEAGEKRINAHVIKLPRRTNSSLILWHKAVAIPFLR